MKSNLVNPMSEYVSEYILTRKVIDEFAERLSRQLATLAKMKLLSVRRKYVERLSPKLLAYLLIMKVLDKAVEKLEELFQITADEIMLVRYIDIFA